MSFTVTVGEVIDDVRFWLGNLPTTVMSDADMSRIINGVMQTTTHTDCDVLYYSTLEVLRWLSRQSEQGSAGSAGSGSLKKKTEQVGSLKVIEEWDVGTSSSSDAGYDKLLADLLAKPSLIGCPITTTTVTGTAASGSVIIGGVSQAAHDKARNDPDAKTAYDVKVPYKQNMKTVWPRRYK